jgi:hypothetical protein
MADVHAGRITLAEAQAALYKRRSMNKRHGGSRSAG